MPAPPHERIFDLLPEASYGIALHEFVRDDAGIPVDYRTTRANRGWQTILKVNRAAVIGRRASEVLPVADVRQWLALLARSILPDSDPSFDMCSAAGGWCIHGAVFPTSDGLVAAVFEDAMDRRAAAERLARSQAELAAIYENAPILMCVLDGERRVVRANRAFTDLAGVPECGLQGGRACGIFGRQNADDDPRGCGFAPACADCGVLGAIDTTTRTGTPCLDVEYRCVLRTPHGIQHRVFLGSTVRIDLDKGPEILLCLRDVTDRVRAEETLTASEQRFAEATAASSEAVWEWPDLEVPRYWWSPRYFEMLGLRPGEFEPTQDTFVELVHPDDRDRIGREMTERIASREPFGSEFRLRTRSGEYRWFASRGLSSARRDGKPARMIGTIRDITDRHVAEEALRQSERIHKTVVDNSPDIIARFDRDLRHVFVNPAVTAATGIPADRFVGRTNRDLGVDAARADILDAALREVFATGRPRPMEFEYPSPDGTRYYSALLVPERAADESVESVLSIARDVSREKRVRLALDTEEHRHRHMLDTLQEGILAFEGTGTVVYANASAARMLGYTGDELNGRALAEIAAADPEEEPLAMLSRWLEEPGARRECTMIRADGTRMAVEVGAGRLVGTPGVSAGIVLSLLDISDRRKAAHELDASRDKLRSLARHLLSVREEERRKVAQEIHDELGQVLTGLGMDLRWLERHLERATPVVKDKVKEATDLADRTIRMVQRISSELRPRMLDDLGLGPALEWLGADFSRRLGIPCTVAVTIASHRIGGNAATTLFRIVQEALTNVARHARASVVSVRLREEDDRLQVEIADDGIGISEVDADGPRSFGLIGMRERVQEIGGDVVISGRSGAGTLVAVTIPFPWGRNLA